jgi:Mn2+/Fe2+ NRAMP family transporter
VRAEDLAGDDALALHRRGAQGARRKLRNSRIDVVVGMAFSVIVMFAIMAATAATLGVQGKTITSAAEAAQALEPIAGSASGYLFAAGFIGSGILAVPVLAASGSAGLAGLLDKPWGLDRSPRRAPVFYALLLVGRVGGAYPLHGLATSSRSRLDVGEHRCPNALLSSPERATGSGPRQRAS